MDASSSLTKMVDIKSSDSIDAVLIDKESIGRPKVTKLDNNNFSDQNTEVSIAKNVLKTFDNTSGQVRPREYKFSDEKLTNQFVAMILEENFEYGYSSNSERFFKKLLKEDPGRTTTWLGTIFLDCHNNSRILFGLLHILSHIRYEVIYPYGQIIALAALSHKSVEVKEGAVRAFENWANTDSLKYLKTVKCEEKWLAEYIDEVISQLEEEIEINAAIG